MSTWFWNSRSSAALRSGSVTLESGTLTSKLMMTLRVQVMWSSQSLRIASWNVSADWLITGLAAGVLPCAGRTPEIAVTASAAATAAISRPIGIDHLRRITKVCSLLNDAETSRGQWNRSHAGEVGIPWRGCDSNLHAVRQPGVRRSAASSPPVTASLRLPAICWSTAPERVLPARSSVPPWGTSNSSRSAYGVAAEVATVFCSAVPGLHAGFAGHERMHHVQAQHVGRLCITPPGHVTPGPIDQDAAVELQDQMGQLRRDAVVDVLQLLPSKTHPPARLRIRSPCLVDPQRQRRQLIAPGWEPAVTSSFHPLKAAKTSSFSPPGTLKCSRVRPSSAATSSNTSGAIFRSKWASRSSLAVY